MRVLADLIFKVARYLKNFLCFFNEVDFQGKIEWNIETLKFFQTSKAIRLSNPGYC
jgi:hypothetical protein